MRDVGSRSISAPWSLGQGPGSLPRGLKLCIGPSCNPVTRRPCIPLPGQLNTLFRDFPRPYVGDRNGKRREKNVQVAVCLDQLTARKTEIGQGKGNAAPQRMRRGLPQGRMPTRSNVCLISGEYTRHQTHNPSAKLLGVSILREDIELSSGSSLPAVHCGCQLLSVDIRSCRKPGSANETLSTVNTSTTERRGPVTNELRLPGESFSLSFRLKIEAGEYHVENHQPAIQRSRLC